MTKILFTLLIITAQTARAQIATPSVRLPSLPQPQLPSVERALTGTVGEVDAQVLKDVRRLRLQDLVRRNRKLLDVDRNGSPIVRGEILAVSPSDAEVNAALAAGFKVVRIRTLEGLDDARIIVLGVPQGMDIQQGLIRLRALMPSVSLDFNHIYTDSGGPDERGADEVAPPAVVHDAIRQGRIGLIDGGVDVAHAVFRGAQIHQHGCEGSNVPSAHGTAVASLMIGHSAQFQGADPGSELYAADVFCGSPAGGAADAVADAFGWLAREKVAVINVSLVGPPNATLEAVVHLIVARGHLIVAAVGNDGPAAAPLYPAAYPGVVGVTGLDTRHHVLIEACRGPHVRFAAPGADMAAAKSAQTFDRVRGTSFAAPIVAGLLAGLLSQPDRHAADAAVEELARGALDLGAPGVDPIYGYGAVGVDRAPQARLAGATAQ